MTVRTAATGSGAGIAGASVGTADPAVSHLHAVLLAQPDGGWEILDPGSANGTQVNDAEIATGTRVPLHDGDRVSLGGWTVLTIVAG